MVLNEKKNNKTRSLIQNSYINAFESRIVNAFCFMEIWNYEPANFEIIYIKGSSALRIGMAFDYRRKTFIGFCKVHTLRNSGIEILRMFNFFNLTGSTRSVIVSLSRVLTSPPVALHFCTLVSLAVVNANPMSV